MRSGFFRSLYFKILGIFVLAVLCLFAVLETSSYRHDSQVVFDHMVHEADTVTELIAMQIGGSVKFGNVVAVDEIIRNVRDYAGDAWIGAHVVDAENTVLYPQVSEESGVVIDDSLVALAIQAAQSGEVVYSADRRSTAHPVYFGANEAAVGAAVTTWTEEPRAAELVSGMVQELIMAGMACLVALGGVGLALRIWVSRPLGSLQNAVSMVAEGDYEITVPGKKRGDEIGSIARELESFRTQLKSGAQMAYDSAFKSAAYEGSSAPMMVINKEFDVIYSNPACASLLNRIGPDLTKVWTGFNGEDVVGSNMRHMPPLKNILDDIVARQHEALPTAKLVAIGDHKIRIKFNSAMDENGNMTGAVVEWSERTASQHNNALVVGIDTAMLRAEFSARGVLSAANENFLKALGLTEDNVNQTKFSEIFCKEDSVSQNPLAEESAIGRFCFVGRNDADIRITDGSCVALKGLDGQVEKTLFVGMDVTENELRQRQSKLAKEKSDAEQQAVVAALGAALKGLASGRLDSQIDEPFTEAYENLRQDYNGAIMALREALSKVAQNTVSIRNETGEITSAADDLSRRTERQAATLEETAAALDELTNSVRSAAEGAQGASEKASAAQDRAQEGGHVAREAVTAMDAIKASSSEISKITSVIDDIAFQTNLLALNAGVEAARAGEAGRGFAVVATEVRALAQRSSDAAREINDLISASENQVRSGVELVDKTGTALSAIVESISEISDLVSNIAVSTKEQASGLNEVNSSVNELDQVTQQNAAMFEETTAASHALTAEADALADAVSRFDLGSQEGAPNVTRVADRGVQATPDETALASKPIPQGSTALAIDDDPSEWEDF